MIAIPAWLQAAVHGANCAKRLSVQGKEPSVLRSFLYALVLSTAGKKLLLAMSLENVRGSLLSLLTGACNGLGFALVLGSGQISFEQGPLVFITKASSSFPHWTAGVE